MSGHYPFSDLTKDFTPERRQRVDDMVRELLAEMPLHKRIEVAEQWMRRLQLGIGYMAQAMLPTGKSKAELRNCAQGITAVVMAEYMTMDAVEREACAQRLLAELEGPLQRAGVVVDVYNPGHIHGLIEQASYSLLLQGQEEQRDSSNDLDPPDRMRSNAAAMWDSLNGLKLPDLD